MCIGVVCVLCVVFFLGVCFFLVIALKLKVSNLEQVTPTFHLKKGILVWELGKDHLTSDEQAMSVILDISVVGPVTF